ncbi:TonB-dependent receptor [Woeseia oceani]|uniref:TonB-dependent receptor n=1 Tax=Woeseia oceani TaxID=1548547 RepID=A0A193LH21_9GAMM|nr:TonB-dependent receptor [Woeseia oceani]ANO51761.1 TonB-dependent receptor [Woeseia oceani]
MTTALTRRALRLSLSAFALFLPALLPTSVTAQETGARTLEEVVVTARRREESLQDVPVSITAFTGEQLDRMGVLDIIEIAKSTPNVTLEVSRGTNTTLTAFIRGVGQQDPVAGYEAGVGMYIDDVYLNRPQAAVLDVYDVERIEVLRGPQGSLYGRNTIGGAIKYVTKKLDAEPTAKARVSLGSYNQLDAVISGSTPLTDQLRIGGSIARLTRDGFGDNLTQSGVENYQKDLFGARISVEWDATDNLSFRLTGDLIDDKSDPRQGHRLTTGNLTGAPILNDVFDTRAGLSVPEQSVESLGGALVAEWTINDRYSLKNVLSYRDDVSYTPIDFDSLPGVDLDVPAVYDNEQFSEELQLIYNGDRLSGLFGFFYLDASAATQFDVILGTTGDLLSLPGLNANTSGNVLTDSWSVFADFTWQWTDEISVSLGGRYTSDERDSRVLRRSFIGGTTFGGNMPTLFATTSDFRGSKTFSEFTPRASISWQPTEEQNLYFTYSEGFKGGSFDPRGQTTGAPDIDGDGDIDEADIFEFMLFDPEYVNSFELGLKSSWMNNRVTTSIAFIYADYTDIQIPGSVGLDTDNDGTQDTFVGITSNAGDADMTGIEFEGLAQLNDQFQLGWSLGYLDAEFNEFIDAFGVDVADQRVFQNTPEVTASTTLSYERPLALFSTPGSFAVITSLSYRDDTSQFETPTPLLDQEAYTLWDLSFVWEDDDGRWRASLHGKNLTDEEYKVAGYYFPSLGLESSITAFYGNPTTWTATVEYNFQ